MAKKSVAKNYIFNLIYQMLTVLLPLVTTPYLSRVLGSEPIGIHGYTVSIVTYFILFGSLGISMYGQREIAYYQNNKKKRSSTFFELIIIRCITLTISIIAFYFSFCRDKEYSTYYLLLAIQIFASMFDISWFFQGMEEFDKTVIRNVIVKLLGLVFIFTLIKKTEDLWIYFLIYVLSDLLGNISLWLYIPKYIEKVKVKELNIKKHIKPTLLLFAPQVAIQIYTVLDKTMIGIISKDMNEVAFYEQAQKIVRAALMVVSSLQTVMNSRIANAYFNNDKKEIVKCLNLSFNFVLTLTIPLCLGLIAIAYNFVPWYYGKGFDDVTNILQISSFLLLAIGLNGVTGVQYLVQTGKQNIFTLSVVIGAISNCIMNYFLIGKLGAYGAAMASVFAETVILIVQIIYIKKEGFYPLKNIFNSLPKCLTSGIIMFIVVTLITKYLPVGIIYTLIEVLIGVLIYFGILKLLRFKFLEEISFKSIFGRGK